MPRGKILDIPSDKQDRKVKHIAESDKHHGISATWAAVNEDDGVQKVRGLWQQKLNRPSGHALMAQKFVAWIGEVEFLLWAPLSWRSKTVKYSKCSASEQKCFSGVSPLFQKCWNDWTELYKECLALRRNKIMPRMAGCASIHATALSASDPCAWLTIPC